MAAIYSSPLESFEPTGKPLLETHPQDDGTDDDNLASSILSPAPRLSSRSVSSLTLNFNRQDEIWSIREVENGEEEFYAKGKCVYWTNNDRIVKSFNFTDQVNRVFWTKFSGRDHICHALPSCISIFDREGQHFQIPLPFAYSEMYPTEVGILIERDCDPQNDSSPVLFALTHPTQEIAPIIFRKLAESNDNVEPPTYYMPDSTSLVISHPKLPLCLMYNSRDCSHSIWKVRRTTQDETEQIQQNDEESTTFANNQSSYSYRERSSNNLLNISNKQRSNIMLHSNPSATGNLNFSPKMDLRGKISMLDNRFASRLGAGTSQLPPDTNSTNIRSFNSASFTNNTTSTPNRRVLNYLRDNIEEVVLPQITCEQIWSDKSDPNILKASRFFSTKDLLGNDYLVTVISSVSIAKLIKYDLKTNENSFDINLGSSQTIEALDAHPIDEMNLMIVIDPGKNLALFSGFDRLANISVPQPPLPSLRQMPASSPHQLRSSGSVETTPIHSSSMRKRSSLGERSSTGSDVSFNQMMQALSPVPHAGKQDFKVPIPVSHNDIRRIDHVIDSRVYVQINNNQRAKFEVPPLCSSIYVSKLINAMKILSPKELGLSIISKWYQARRSPSQSYVMKVSDEIQLFKNWFLQSLGLTGDFFGESSNRYMSKSPDLAKSLIAATPKKTRRTKDVDTNRMTSNLPRLFYALHLVFEELLLMKINTVVRSLSELLIVLACLLKLPTYQEYYWLKFPDLNKKYGDLKESCELVISKKESLSWPIYFQENPPSVTEFLWKIVSRNKYNFVFPDDKLDSFPYIPKVTDHIYIVLSLFCEMFNINIEKGLRPISSELQEFKSVNLLTKVPRRTIKSDQRVVELMVELGQTRSSLSALPEGINLYLWDAVLNCRESPPAHWNDLCYELVGRIDLVTLIQGQPRVTQTATVSKNNEDETLKLLFPDDIRVAEAQRMLASDTPVEFNVTQRQNANEDETKDEIQRYLYLLNVRTMAQPVGRGAICLRTYSPVIGETFEVPMLELLGRLLAEDRVIEHAHDTNVHPWPYFHNGVAAGLTICASTANNIIDSTWINYNRPRSNLPPDTRDRDLAASNMNNEHAGFLFALGLNDHLEKLSLMALHDYLCQNNDLTKLAILLGMSAAKRGTRDNNIIKVLSIHVDALLPPNSTELDVPAPVHAASIMGVGLLYQGSGDSHISKVLLEEIGRLPGAEVNSHLDRESYALSAGLAFGLVNLCKGGSTTISSSDQLRLYMLGGKRKQLTAATRERYLKQDCHRGEEEYINTHVTSPGGTLGLGLMYHRSGNKSVADWMKAPETQTLLEYVRPDFLILRMISYGLIMWNDVQPTSEWVESQAPKIVSTHAFQRNAAPAHGKLLETPSVNSNIDYELISQSYCNILAGCCMAIALRFAGTADKRAYKTVYGYMKMFIQLSGEQKMVEFAGRPCFELCMNVTVTALAVIMAGTGDLGVMKVCRFMRSRVTQPCVFYGSHMAVHLALGILFLGNCRYSLSISPESIAALVCALYPLYPDHSSNNRYHLQALRHLYVLASEPRLLIPRDILTDKPVYVSITVLKKDNHSGEKVRYRCKAPCLLPEVGSINCVWVDDPKYWKIEISSKEALRKCLEKDQGCLSVKQKADSSNNHIVQNIERHILGNMKPGYLKTRKSSALGECIKEDRVEQYSALNRLLTKSRTCEAQFKSLILEQIRLALSLNNDQPDKYNLLRPVISQFESEFNKEDTTRAWIDYLSQETDWTNTEAKVAHYISLNDLTCSEVDLHTLHSLRELTS